jgi:RimJ/RimL family protein N-acetyltransferase
MIHRLSTLSRRAKYIFHTEGLIPLIRQGFTFLAGYFFRYRTLYLYQHIVGQGNEAEFVPRVQDFTLEVISTSQQADELAARGFDFRWQVGNFSQRLDKGAIAFCIFVGQELAHIGWIAPTQEAKESLHEPPYKVDYSNGEVCTGSTWTNPKYRGKGLMTYGYFKRFQFLKERGISASRAAVDKGNIASQRMIAKFNTGVYAKVRYLKILCWKSWKEEPPN